MREMTSITAALVAIAHDAIPASPGAVQGCDADAIGSSTATGAQVHALNRN